MKTMRYYNIIISIKKIQKKNIYCLEIRFYLLENHDFNTTQKQAKPSGDMTLHLSVYCAHA